MPEAFDLDDSSTSEPKEVPPTPDTPTRPGPPQARPSATVGPATITPSPQGRTAPPTTGNRASDLLRGHPNYKQSVERDTTPKGPLILQDRGVTRFDDFATGVFWFAFIFVGLCLLYFLWAVFSGSLSKGISATALQQYTANLQLASQIFTISSIVATVMMVFLFYDEAFASYSLVGFAVFLWFILPLIIDQYFDMSKTMPAVLTDGTNTKQVIDGHIRSVAYIPGLPGVLLLIWEMARQAIGKFETAKIAKKNLKFGQGMVFKQPKVRNQFLGPCWNMPYCRDQIRAKCPIYIGRRKGPCWRNKRGCMCDETIVLNATAGDWKDQVASTVNALDGGTGRTVAHSTILTPMLQPVSEAYKKERCRQCVIYNTHQEQKYKALVALVFAVVVGGFGLFSDVMVDFVKNLYNTLDATLGRFSFNGNSGPVANQTSGGIQLGDPVAWVILIMLTIIVLSKILQFVEYCCFKAKI